MTETTELPVLCFPGLDHQLRPITLLTPLGIAVGLSWSGCLHHPLLFPPIAFSPDARQNGASIGRPRNSFDPRGQRVEPRSIDAVSLTSLAYHHCAASPFFVFWGSWPLLAGLLLSGGCSVLFSLSFFLLIPLIFLVPSIQRLGKQAAQILISFLPCQPQDSIRRRMSFVSSPVADSSA